MKLEFTKANGYESAELVRHGLDHLSAAKVLLVGSPEHFDGAGYLVHMAFELFLKAWLLEVAGGFPRKHRLAELYEPLTQKFKAPALTDDQSSQFDTLDRFEHLRYPTPGDGVEIGTEDLKWISELADFICDSMPQKVIDETFALDPIRKGQRVLMKKRIDQ